MISKVRVHVIGVLGLFLPMVSCSQSPPECPNSSSSGELVVNVVSSPTLPAIPALVANGSSFGKETTFFDAGVPVTLPSGPYTLQGKRVRVPPASGEIIGTAYYAKSNDLPVCVHAGGTATVTMTYDLDPGSGRLWITRTSSSNPSSVLVAYDSADLVTTGSPVPSASLTSDPSVARTAVLDFEGNLLIAGTPSIDDVLKWRAERLGSPVMSPPDVGVGLHGLIPSAMALDITGSLWVGAGMGALTGVSNGALVTGGVVDAVISLVSISGFGTASALAFDKAGDIWAAAGGYSVYEFAPPTLTTSAGSPVSKAMLTASSSSGSTTASSQYVGAQSMAFDSQGNLWLGYTSGNHITRFTPTDQAAGGLVVAPADIVPSGGATLTSLAFDETGGLWYPVGLGQIARIPASIITSVSSGSMMVTPDIVIDGGDQMGMPLSLIFDPAPSGSPINDATPSP